MKLNVSEQLKLAGKVAHAAFTVAYEPLDYLGRTTTFAAPLSIDLSYVYDGGGFTVEGTLKTLLASECALCGRAFEEPFGFSFSERFMKNPSEEDDCYEYRGEELDLSRMVGDLIFLNLPLGSVCAENCKGLCPVCGRNLNHSRCSCVQEEERVKNPFLSLGTLLNDDKEV